MKKNSVVLQFTEEQAREYLNRWLKNNHHKFSAFGVTFTRWDYMEMSFYSADVDGMMGMIIGHFGFHIHADGEVILCGKMADKEYGKD